MAALGDPPRCRCGQYHIMEIASAVVTVPCPYGWDSNPLAWDTGSPVFHCPGCRCDEPADA